MTAPAADVQFRDLGLDDPHPLIVSMWEAIQTSAEGRFWSAADWERARMEMFYADATLRNPTAAAWDRVQKGLSDLLISPAAKRRAAIELKAAAVDADEEAAVSMMSGYKAKLQSVKTE